MTKQGKGTKAENTEKLRSLALQREKTLQNVRSVLGLAIEHLSRAAEGQEEALDSRIDALREQMRNGLPSPMAVNQLGSSVQGIGAVRRNRAEKQLRGFSDCVAQLLSLDPPTEIRRELGAFISNARKTIVDPEQQQMLTMQLAAVQSKVLAGVFDGSQRLGEEVAAEAVDIEALYADDSLKNLPAYSSVAETIEHILTDLLVSIRAPQQAEAALDKAKKILGAGLNWYELAALLEQVAIVVSAALVTDQHEFEAFLQSLNVHLSSVSGSFDNLSIVGASIVSSGDALDADIRQGMSSLADELDDTNSIESLQSSVQNHLDTVLLRLNNSQYERGGLQEQYEEQISGLKAKIEQLEKDAIVANSEIQEQQRRSESDQLTGLPNRVAYERRLGIELERWERYEQKFCLVVADIDHFKLINDRYGHLAGDKVLKVVSDTIRKRLRRIDYIARYGGEEFVILLPATESEQARALIEDLGKKIRDCPFHYHKEPLEITLSFGVASILKNDSPETLFERADAALYEAKRGGRDQTVVARVA